MDIVEQLLEYFDEETVAFILQEFSEDEIIEMLESLAEDDEEDDHGGSGVVKQLQAINKSIDKSLKKIDVTIARLKSLGFAPPILKADEKNSKKQLEAVLKLKNSDFKKLQKQVTGQEETIQFLSEQQKINNRKSAVKSKLVKLELEIKAAWGRFWQKCITAIGIPGIIVVFIGILVMVLIIAVSAMFSTEDEVKKNGMTSVSGINSTDFYGARLIYEDKEQETLELVKNFAGVLADAVNVVETENASVDITINVDETVNYLNAEPIGDVVHVKNVITNISKVVYEIDNPGNPIPAVLTDIVGGIKYFGINEVDQMQEKVAQAISNYINENDLYTKKQGVSELPADIETKIETSVLNSLKTNNIRTEKLFVEDQIFKTSSDALTIKTSRNYKAMIFMPKKDVVINYFSFKTYGIDPDNFKIYVENNGTEIKLDTTEVKEVNQYYHESNNNLTVQATKFTAVDELKPINGALSLVPSVDGYLQIAKDAEGNDIANVYTYSNDGVMVKFESNTKFMFSEVETKWE